MSDAYFVRTGATTLTATEHVSGAWRVEEQHIAPPMGLLAHVVEVDRDRRRGADLVVRRLCFDILGTLPVGPVETSVEVVRPGRTIELVEATLGHGGRVGLRLRAWLLAPGDTSSLAGGGPAALPPPEELPPFDPTTVWPGGFIASVELRRAQAEPGRATFWVRTPLPLLADEPVSPLAATAGLLDIANGMTVRVSPREVAFPNLDLTAHLLREPAGGWVGFDTTVAFSAEGTGLTTSAIHDTRGWLGTSTQVLTVRPGAASG